MIFANGLLDLLVEALPTVAGLLTEPVLFQRLFEEIHRDGLSPQSIQAWLGMYLREEQRLGRLAVADATPIGTLLMGAVTSSMVQAAHRLEAAAPNARAVVWPDVAHMIGMEAPDRLNALIVAVLAPLRPWE